MLSNIQDTFLIHYVNLATSTVNATFLQGVVPTLLTISLVHKFVFSMFI